MNYVIPTILLAPAFVAIAFGIMIVISILFTAFWIWMLVDSIQRTYKNREDKIAWILVIVLTNLIGALIYYFVVYGKKKKR